MAAADKQQKHAQTTAAKSATRTKKVDAEETPKSKKSSGKKPNPYDESATNAATTDDADVAREVAPTKKTRGKGPVDLGAALIEAFATHERIHQYLLEHLEPSAWNAEAPIGKGRTIRGIVAHIHNVRLMWLGLAAEGIAAPAKVDRNTVTLDEARAALSSSAAALTELLHRSLAAGGHVKDFKPDVLGFVSYVIAHEAHHRGQICMLARLLGHPLPQQVGFGMWEWRKRHGEAVPKE